MSLVALALAAAVLVSCGSDEPSPAAGGPRTVEIAMLDELRFEPSSVEVSEGETVRFVITNEGAIVHDFSVGSEHHMGATGHMDLGTAVVLEPGETGELTYTFAEAGEVEFGCHQPGHLEAGMVFTATVT